MLDILISRLKEEIAIDGSSGCCIDQVWEYVESISKAIAEESGTTISPLVDEKYKAFIWNYLKLEENLEFYENIASQDQQPEDPTATPAALESITTLVDVIAPELEEPVLELMNRVEAAPTSSKKRKNPPKPSKKSTPKKKPSKKIKKTVKKKKKAVAADSDDDYEAAEDSSSSSSESEFEEDVDELDESDGTPSEAESEGYDSNEGAPSRKKPNAQLAPKAEAKKAKKNKIKPTLKIIERIYDLTYEEIVEKYGSRLYVAGSIELQEQQLYIGIPPGANLSPNLVFILQEILKTRNKGLLQAEVTKILDIDSRSTGHYCKSLEEKGAIIRNGVSTQKMRTNSCIHARYGNKKTEIEIDEDDDDTPYNVNSKGVVFSQRMFHDALIDLMKDAPNYIILSEDIMRALGFDNTKTSVRKWYNRTLNELCEKGHIMKTNVKVEGASRPRRCIQLLRTPQLASIADDLPIEDYKYPIRISGNKNDIPILSFPVDCTMESQLLQVLMVAGENGCTQKELEFALNTDDKRMIYKMLEKMCEMKGIALERFGAKRLLEFEGKLRRYRYYTYPAYKKMHENIDLIPQLLPDEDTLGFALREKDLFIDVPHSLRLYQKFMLKCRRELGLMPSQKAKKLADGTVDLTPPKRGRPRKTPADGSAASKAPSAKKKGKQPEKVPGGAEASNTSNNPNEPVPTGNITNTSDNTSTVNPVPATVISVDALTVEKPGVPINAATTLPETFAESSTTDVVMRTAIAISPITLESDISLEVNTEPIVIKNSETPISANNTSDGENILPTTLVRRRESISSVEEIPCKKAKQSDATVTSEVTASPTANLMDPITQHEASFRSPIAATPVQKPTSRPNPKNGPKRTIADYFTKATRPSVERTSPASVTDTDATNVQLAEPNIEQVDSNSQTVEASLASTPVENTDTDMEVATLEDLVPNAASSDIASVIDVPADAATVPEGPEANPDNNILSTENLTTESSNTTNTAIEQPVTESPNVETSAIKGPQNAVGVFKRGYAHKVKQVNIYMEIRMKVLLTILEECPMWEIGKTLRDAYLAKATEISGSPKYAVCTKTLWRSASALAERGEAKIDVVECVLLTGAIVKRNILLHKNVDMQGKAYTAFKKNLQDRRAYQQPYYLSQKVATIVTPVESLETRIDRMKLQLEELVQNEKTAEAKALQLRIDEFSENAQRYKRTPARVSKSWMITGIQFGWIRARMIRIKLLYFHIFGLLTSEENIDGVDKENRRIDMSAVINTLSLNLYCNIIGIFHIVPSVVQYVRNPENRHVTFKDMPNSIREELFSDKNKFRRRLRALFYGLEYLELIKSIRFTFTGVVPAEKYSLLFGNFSVEKVVPVRDVRKLGKPVVREHILDTVTDATLYWSELQFICTQADVELAPEDKEPEPTNAIELECWKSVCHAPGWNSASVYTRGQRKILNSYVDKVKGTTPLKDYPLCADIAEELNTSTTYVRRYFAKVEVAIERKRLHREEKALERRLKPVVRRTKRKIKNNIDGRRVINLSSTRAFRPVVIPTHVYPKDDLLDEPFNSKEEFQSEGQDLFMDKIDDVPVLSNSTMTMRLRRKGRQTWSIEDDELLIYSYVILRLRATSRSLFRWPAIKQVFPSRKSESCRHRLNRMLTDTVYMEQLETATTLWSKFYTEGIQSGELQDPNPREMVDFDLLSFLTYFLKRLNDEGPLFEQIFLPANLLDIKNHYTVSSGVTNANPYYHEDRFYNSPTLITKMGALYYQSFSARRVRDNEYDTNQALIEAENNVDNRIIELLKVFSMMCLLTPAEKYDPYYAHYAIIAYPKHLHQLAIDELRADGALIQAKTDRSVPNTKYGLSAKLGSLMAGKLPENMLVQAKEYYKYLSEQTSSNRFLPEFVSSGMMACLLSLLSENKLNFAIANKASKMKIMEHAHFHSRLTDRSLTVFDLDLQLSNSSESPVISSVKSSPDIANVSALDFDIQFNNFLKTQREDLRKQFQLIVGLLRIQEGNGLSLYQLKLKCDDQIDDKSILHAIDLLSYSNPPLVMRVGFGSPRYVLSMYIDSWTISNEAVSNLAIIKSRKTDRLNSTNDSPFDKKIDRKSISHVKLWTDVNGYTTDLVLKDCKNVIMDYILRRPGSSDANIYRNFSKAFSRVNLQEILQMLVEERILRKVCLVQQHETKARKSIFSKTNSFRCTTQPVIEKFTQTCYWLNNPYS